MYETSAIGMVGTSILKMSYSYVLLCSRTLFLISKVLYYSLAYQCLLPMIYVLLYHSQTHNALLVSWAEPNLFIFHCCSSSQHSSINLKLKNTAHNEVISLSWVNVVISFTLTHQSAFKAQHCDLLGLRLVPEASCLWLKVRKENSIEIIPHSLFPQCLDKV